MQDKFTEKAQEVLKRAEEAAATLGSRYVGTEHILLGLTLVPESVAAKALEGRDISYHQVMEKISELEGRGEAGGVPADYTPRAKRVIECSEQEAARLHMNYVGTEHILMALIRENDNMATKIMESLDTNPAMIYDDILVMLGESEGQSANCGMGMNGRQQEKEDADKAETLEKYSRDLTALAKKDTFDPIEGRDHEIERINQILSRRTKNNP